MCWVLREWLKYDQVLAAMKLSKAQAEVWRCKCASVFRADKANWIYWAKINGIKIISQFENYKTGDFVIYDYSHIELFVDDSPPSNFFTAIGYNTNSAGSRDGEGCFEKTRSRDRVKCLIRIMD
jgi:hypothetical protein